MFNLTGKKKLTVSGRFLLLSSSLLKHWAMIEFVAATITWKKNQPSEWIDFIKINWLKNYCKVIFNAFKLILNLLQAISDGRIDFLNCKVWLYNLQCFFVRVHHSLES